MKVITLFILVLIVLGVTIQVVSSLKNDTPVYGVSSVQVVSILDAHLPVISTSTVSFLD